MFSDISYKCILKHLVANIINSDISVFMEKVAKDALFGSDTCFFPTIYET
jgi:hypothetical protein